MADVKNIITLGIGASPGNLIWFITSGLEGEPDAPGIVVARGGIAMLDVGNYIADDDLGWQVRPILMYLGSVYFGRWGSARFGSNEILGKVIDSSSFYSKQKMNVKQV